MSGADFSAAIVALVLLVALIGAGFAVRRNPGGNRIEPGKPDAVSAEVVSGLMTELRKWQAEAAYWKDQADRLQQQLDGD